MHVQLNMVNITMNVKSGSEVRRMGFEGQKDEHTNEHG